MKAQLSGKKYNRGVATLEILIAFAILVLTMSAVIMVVFGNQSISVDSQTSNEALGKAQKMLEDARAMSRQNYLAVTSTTSIETVEGLSYTKILSVSDLTQCKKQATSTVTWTDSGRPQKIELSTFFADIATAVALGGDCESDPTSTGWFKPDNFNSIDFSPSGIPATGLDVKSKIVFMTGNPSASSDPDFYIFDARNASTTTPPHLLWSLDTGNGLNAVDAITSQDGNFYAFVANNDTSLSPLKQLIVLKEPQTLATAPVVIASSTLPGVSGNCPNFCPQGRSIYYFAPYIYIGTHRTGGHEFHIFDVSNPTNPIPKGSIELNHNVNDIMVINQTISGVSKRFAYLATSGNPTDLFILDVTDPTNILIATSTNVGGNEDAKSLYILGNNLYIGKDRSTSSNDFFIVDISNPYSPQIKGSKRILSQNNTSITGIRVIGNLAFIGNTDSNDPFQVWDISDPTNIIRHDTSHYNFSQQTVDIDYESDRIYTANESNDALRIIYGNP